MLLKKIFMWLGHAGHNGSTPLQYMLSE
jgi:hypothetical protein